MSYLLDALRKAERERKLGRVPDLSWEEAEPPADVAGTRVNWALWLVAAAVVINAAALIVLWPDHTAPLADNSQVTSMQPAAEPVPEPVSEPAPQPQAETDQTPISPPVARQPVRSPPRAGHRSARQEFDLPAPAPLLSALPAQQRASIPVTDLNGMLYSTIPGRSFVLVDGQRYRQGERTKAGPAVVLIDPQGVVFDWRGTRYRLPAPY